VRDLAAAQAYLARRFPGQPLFLVGISLGAAVSLQALPRLGEVRGVWSERAYSQLEHAEVNEFRWLPGWVRNPLVEFYYRLGWLDCGFWRPAINLVDALDHLNVPIYFCHARQDELVPCAEGEALFQRYAGPRWHWWVEDATHYNIRQRHPDEYLHRLRAFLESHLIG
jgi:alpha-beta hydrolase superfamily lysophospholipase